MNVQPFPAQAKTMQLSATTSAGASTALPAAASVLHIINEGPNNAYFSVGTGAQTATTPSATPAATCTPILSGLDVVMSIPSDQIQNVSVITKTGTAVINFQVSEGQ